jgi:hypothetical protein
LRLRDFKTRSLQIELIDPFLVAHDLSQNRLPPRIKSEASLFPDHARTPNLHGLRSAQTALRHCGGQSHAATLLPCASTGLPATWRPENMAVGRCIPVIFAALEQARAIGSPEP